MFGTPDESVMIPVHLLPLPYSEICAGWQAGILMLHGYVTRWRSCETCSTLSTMLALQTLLFIMRVFLW